jgi:hypothetical protein
MKIARALVAVFALSVAAAACNSSPTLPEVSNPSQDMSPVIGSGLGGGL